MHIPLSGGISAASKERWDSLIFALNSGLPWCLALLKIKVAEMIRVPSLSWKRPFFSFLSFSSPYCPTRRPEPAFMKMNNQMESLYQHCQGTCCCHSSEPLARAAQGAGDSWNLQLITNVVFFFFEATKGMTETKGCDQVPTAK